MTNQISLETEVFITEARIIASWTLMMQKNVSLFVFVMTLLAMIVRTDDISIQALSALLWFSNLFFLIYITKKVKDHPNLHKVYQITDFGHYLEAAMNERVD